MKIKKALSEERTDVNWKIKKGAVSLSLQPYEYLTDRLDDQINWYDKKSTTQKKWYYCLKVVTLICTSSIPVSSVIFRHQSFTAIITAIMAAIATVTDRYHDIN